MFTGSQILGRESLFAQALELVDAGLSAWLVGSRLSGRTSVLKELKKRLEDNDWTCIELSGNAGLSAVPLASLLVTRNDETADPRGNRSGLVEVSRDLHGLVRPTRTVLVVDDADQLDELSIGLIGAVAREHGVSIIAASLPNPQPHTSLPFSSAVHGLTLTLGPVGFDDLEGILRDRLGAPVDVDTMSRIFAKSSGTVGVACAIAEAAIIEKRMLRAPRSGVWHASESLWSSSLDSVVGMYVQSLSDEEVEGLETIAMAGIVDVATVRKIVATTSLETLEARGLLRTAVSGNRQVVSIVPALIVESIRNRATPMHRARLADQLSSHINQTETLAVSDLMAKRGATSTFDPIYVRLHIEHAHAALVSTSANWHATPNAFTATAYIRALLNTNADADRIQEVIDATPCDTYDAPARADYAILRAEWLAIVTNDLPGALSFLEGEAQALSDGYQKLVVAASVRLRCLLDRVPEDFADLLLSTPADPEPVRIRLAETLMFVHLTLGQLALARDAFELIPADHTNAYTSLANESYGWLLLAEGRFAEASRWTERSLTAASHDLDADAMLPHAYLGATLAVFSSDYTAADNILARVIAIGDSSPLLAHTQLGLWVIGTVLVIRRGNLAVAERFLRGLHRHNVTFGPLMGQSLAVATAQMDTYNGDVEAAVDDLWAEAERAWNRGHCLAAMQLMMMTAEMQMTPDRLAMIRERMQTIEGNFLHSFLQFLEAREARNAPALIDLVPLLCDTGRPGLGALALDIAERLTSEQKLDLRDEIDRSRQDLVESTGGRRLDTKRFLVSAVSLTEREREIVDLVARGLSNPDIAARLVLSVRTVESHLSRILKKAEARTREELIEYYTEYWR